jgi:hypothetical protein
LGILSVVSMGTTLSIVALVPSSLQLLLQIGIFATNFFFCYCNSNVIDRLGSFRNVWLLRS